MASVICVKQVLDDRAERENRARVCHEFGAWLHRAYAISTLPGEPGPMSIDCQFANLPEHQDLGANIVLVDISYLSVPEGCFLTVREQIALGRRAFPLIVGVNNKPVDYPSRPGPVPVGGGSGQSSVALALQGHGSGVAELRTCAPEAFASAVSVKPPGYAG